MYWRGCTAASSWYRCTVLVLATELMEGGDLCAALAADVDGALTWRRGGRQVALDIAGGLVYLHANNVTHRDLKSKNVLLTGTGGIGLPAVRAKVADVGAADLHSATYLSAGSGDCGGTLAWAAPELLLGQPCTHKIDIYSLGVVLWELATREAPVRGQVAPPPPSDASPAGLAELIGDCLQQDPQARPTAAQALERLQGL